MEKQRIGNTKELSEEERIKIIERSSRTVGRAVFFSILVTLISFSPILFLEGQEKKMFSPLVWTKTFTMIGSAIIALFVVPMLLRSLMKGKLIPESRNPIANFFIKIYSPVLRLCQHWKKTVIAIAALIVVGSIPFVVRLGSEFMPPLDEGSLLFMPVTLPDVSNNEAKRILQVQDKLIMSVPEVENVLGKAGRAYTATDNAPVSMIESIVVLKPQSEWRKGMTTEKLISELNEKVQIPGVTSGWTQPIINRINMLSTGVRTDIGVKIYGQNLDTIYNLSRQIEKSLKGIDGLADLYVEQLTGGKYLDIRINREEIARYNLSIEEVNMLIEMALGGMPLTNTIEGRQRFSVSIRLAQDFRSDIEEIKRTPLQTSGYGVIPLSAVADVEISEGPPMINSENAMLRGTVLFNVRGRDMGSVVGDAKKRIDADFQKLPKGYFIEWSGQYENKVRAENRLKIIIPITLLIIAFVLYFTFHSVKEMVIVLSSIPIALIGGVYSMYFFDVNFSVAVAVGFIALFGIAVETGVLMLVYMNEAIRDTVEKKKSAELSNEDVEKAVFSGAVMRVRPKLMTVMADMIGLMPILLATGVGSDVMKPITIPFVFGLITSTLFVLIVLPVIYQIVKEREIKKYGKVEFLENID
ncbi:efflux RND transporter permease subunit [Flavobacterium coralii]|uniref:efflux RND transporter permease subunit n=1 Tax=Flavobacterium coralii TaxID=2838017 RepID=UPI000C69301D|nr:metal transporter [Flavobacterium sp.]|tara:strand:- start:92179 stop:94098 length:1920 start_codon:yes stop_codon:yes gene_type:complete